MRATEHEINNFLTSHLLSAKEDLLSTAQQSKTKRNLQILLSIDHGTGEGGSDFSIKIEGKL